MPQKHSGPLGVDEDVTDLWVLTAGATVDRALHDDSTPDAGAESEHQQSSPVRTPRTRMPFPERRRVRVVLQTDRHIERLAQRGDDVGTLPRGETEHVVDCAAFGTHRPGAPDADTRQPTGIGVAHLADRVLDAGARVRKPMI
jgi:hypothetical protein